MSVRAFITGVGGFAGSHLAEALLAAGDSVQGTLSPGGSADNLRWLPKSVPLHRLDIRSGAEVAAAVRKARPDVVYHLAALSHVPEGDRDPRAVLEVNFLGTLSVLEALRTEAPGARCVLISSAEVYGAAAAHPGRAISEDHPKTPVHAYGLSKLAAELLADLYGRTRGITVVCLRPFNHIGPRQSDRFVCSSLARQIARIELGLQDPILKVGDLKPVRDFTDVRDMVRAYRLAAERCPPGSVFQISSGVGVSIETVLKEFLSFSDLPIEVRQDPSRLRRTDVPVLIGDPSRFRRATGWAPRFSLRQSLRDLYSYWKEKESSQGAPAT